MASLLAGCLMVLAAAAAPSPTPWALGTVYQDAACSVPWAPRTQRWDRLDGCSSFAEGESAWQTSNVTHLHSQVFSPSTTCTGKVVSERWTEFGVCFGGAGGYSILKPAAAPDPLPNTIVHHWSNAVDCSSEPMMVQTYPANQCYDPNNLPRFQNAVCDVPSNKVTILAQCLGSTCLQAQCEVTNITLGCANPHKKYICNVD